MMSCIMFKKFVLVSSCRITTLVTKEGRFVKFVTSFENFVKIFFEMFPDVMICHLGFTKLTRSRKSAIYTSSIVQ